MTTQEQLDKILEMLQSSNKDERVLAVQMICRIPFEDAVHTIFGFSMSPSVRDYTDHNSERMLIHACFELKMHANSHFTVYPKGQKFVQTYFDSLSGGMVACPKSHPWLCLEDIDKLELYREIIEPYGIESSIDDWETNYNNGNL